MGMNMTPNMMGLVTGNGQQNQQQGPFIDILYEY